MLGGRIAVDGNYGAETRQVVTSFQMRTGVLADGVAGAQTEAKLLSEVNRMRETYGTYRAKLRCAAIVHADVGSRLGLAGTWSLRKTLSPTGAAVVRGNRGDGSPLAGIIISLARGLREDQARALRVQPRA
jgi:peptidoglycan hydrolase-like protein with peptidoglycan-binding domain